MVLPPVTCVKKCITCGCVQSPPKVEPILNQLQARLALLERGTNVKSEPGAAVKREWEDREDAGPHQRRRKAVKIETVDLTGD